MTRLQRLSSWLAILTGLTLVWAWLCFAPLQPIIERQCLQTTWQVGDPLPEHWGMRVLAFPVDAGNDDIPNRAIILDEDEWVGVTEVGVWVGDAQVLYPRKAYSLFPSSPANAAALIASLESASQARHSDWSEFKWTSTPTGSGWQRCAFQHSWGRRRFVYHYETDGELLKPIDIQESSDVVVIARMGIWIIGGWMAIGIAAAAILLVRTRRRNLANIESQRQRGESF